MVDACRNPILHVDSLSEALYETARYVAQIQSTLRRAMSIRSRSPGISNGVNFATSGAGSIGTSEITALVGTETCPAGYITSACGRDPYFLDKTIPRHGPPALRLWPAVGRCDRLYGRRTDTRPEYPDGSARLCACSSWAALQWE